MAHFTVAIFAFISTAVAQQATCPSVEDNPALNLFKNSPLTGYFLSTFVDPSSQGVTYFQANSVMQFRQESGKNLVDVTLKATPSCSGPGCKPSPAVDDCKATYEVTCYDRKPSTLKFNPVGAPSCLSKQSPWRCNYYLTSNFYSQHHEFEFSMLFRWDLSTPGNLKLRGQPMGSFFTGCGDDPIETTIEARMQPTSSALLASPFVQADVDLCVSDVADVYMVHYIQTSPGDHCVEVAIPGGMNSAFWKDQGWKYSAPKWQPGSCTDNMSDWPALDDAHKVGSHITCNSATHNLDGWDGVTACKFGIAPVLQRCPAPSPLFLA